MPPLPTTASMRHPPRSVPGTRTPTVPVYPTAAGNARPAVIANEVAVSVPKGYVGAFSAGRRSPTFAGNPPWEGRDDHRDQRELGEPARREGRPRRRSHLQRSGHGDRHRRRHRHRRQDMHGAELQAGGPPIGGEPAAPTPSS